MGYLYHTTFVRIQVAPLIRMLTLKACLRRLKAWITNEAIKEEELVNEESESESDEDNQGNIQVRKTKMSKKGGGDKMKIRKEDTREEIIEKFNNMKKELKNMKETVTRLEYEVDSLRDDRDEREEELRMQRMELLKLVELSKVVKQEMEGDKITIKM